MNETNSTSTMNPEISPTVAQSLLSDAVILDVRTPAEFEEMHIPGSVLHPLSDLDAEKVRDMMGTKSHCLVLCRSGNRAKQAAKKLAAAGVESLTVIEGGVVGWEAAGLPVNRGTKTMSLERQVRIAAGAFVLAGVLLSVFVNPAWIALSGFVGAGLMFAGITDTCGMGMMLAKMPWNNRQPSASCCSTK